MRDNFRATCPTCGLLQPPLTKWWCVECGDQLGLSAPEKNTYAPLPADDLLAPQYREGGRYVVRETEGFTITSSQHLRLASYMKPNLSAVVLDTLTNYRRVHEFRTEDLGSKLGSRRYTVVRERARGLAARLNAEAA